MHSRARVAASVMIAAVALSCEQQQPTTTPTAPEFSRSSAPGQSVACTDKPGEHNAKRHGPVVLACAFALPMGSAPIFNGTKSWVYKNRYYLTEVGNAAVFVFDVFDHTSVGKITGFIGKNPAATPNAAISGPNSITFDKGGHAWVSDGVDANGHSTVRVVDLASMSIIHTVNTEIAACDNAAKHRCQRTNEITYDPDHNLIFVQNPSPLDTAGATGAPIDTYGTFIDATSFAIVGTISFPNRQNQEAPLWDPDQHRILSAVGGRQVVTNGVVTAVYPQYLAVINPTTRTVEHEYDIDCTALGLVGPTSAANPTGRLFGLNDPSLAPHGRIVTPACGRAVFMDAHSGMVTGFAPIAGGNETWYNSGDGNFYVTGAPFLGVSATAAGKNSLGVIEAKESELEQYVPADTSVGVIGATNPASSKKNNQTFAVVPGNATTATACTQFGFQASGCILVFAHEPGKGDQDKDDHDDGKGNDDDD